MISHSILPQARPKESNLIHRLAVLFVLPLFVACGPTLLLPGGALNGTTAPPPANWTWTDDFSTIQLETRIQDPYSVNLWIIAIDQKLYVHAGANRSTWVENIELDSAVRVLIDEKIYSLSATRVEDQAEFDAFSNAYEVKYGTRPRNENVDEAYLFYLTTP
jgi:hypothetical protein